MICGLQLGISIRAALATPKSNLKKGSWIAPPIHTYLIRTHHKRFAFHAVSKPEMLSM